MDPTLVKNKYDKNKTAYKKYLSVADIKKAIPHLQKISDLAYQKTALRDHCQVSRYISTAFFQWFIAAYT